MSKTIAGPERAPSLSHQSNTSLFSLSTREQRRFASSEKNVHQSNSPPPPLLHQNAPLPGPRRSGSTREHRFDELGTGVGAEAGHAAPAASAASPRPPRRRRCTKLNSSSPTASSRSASAGLHHQLPLPEAEHARHRRRAVFFRVRHRRRGERRDADRRDHQGCQGEF